VNRSSPFASIFPEVEAAALRQGLGDLVAGRIERFTHIYVGDGPQGPRSQQWEVSLFRLGAAMHFMALPAGIADAPATAAALSQALRQAVSHRVRGERHYSIEAPGGEPRRVCVAPIRLGRRTHLVAYPDDAPSLDQATPPQAERLLFAQEEERHRIAIELHDSTSQHLVAVSLGLARLRRFVRGGRAERRVLDEMSRTLQAAIKEIRTFSFLMNPPQLARDGLEATARRFVAGFQARTGIETSFAVAGRPDAASAAVQHTLFRVLQEALTSAYRRADATRVDVALTRRAGWVRLTIADNDAAGVEGENPLLLVPVGVGIAGMHAPVVQLGGSLQVEHDADGARVTARLPLAAPPPAGHVRRRSRRAR
jgi:signal transduction histidine kinase